MACNGELLVLQWELKDLEAASELVVVPLVWTIQWLLQGKKLKKPVILSISTLFVYPYNCIIENFVVSLEYWYVKYLFQNGDYAYDIPEQYATSKSAVSTRYCRLVEQSDSRNVSKGHLCADCIKLESLKLLELSKFEPKSERRYNSELKRFKEYLERRYPLCDNCKLTVQNILSKQAVWLTRYKMLFFRQKPIRMLISVSIHVWEVCIEYNKNVISLYTIRRCRKHLVIFNRCNE